MDCGSSVEGIINRASLYIRAVDISNHVEVERVSSHVEHLTTIPNLYLVHMSSYEFRLASEHEL